MLQDRTLDKTTPIPLYYQLKQLILGEIQDQQYKSGDMIPTEQELSAMFDISRTTVRQAITELTQEGYLRRVKSKGTFVTKPKIERHIGFSIQAYEEEILASGRQPTTQILKFEEADMPAKVISMDVGAASGKVYVIERLRLADDRPLTYGVSYVPKEKGKNLTRELLEQMTPAGIMNQSEETRTYRITRICEALPASKEHMEVLHLKPGSAVLKLTSIRYTREGELLEVSFSYFRADKQRIHFEEIVEE